MFQSSGFTHGVIEDNELPDEIMEEEIMEASEDDDDEEVNNDL